MPNTYTVLSTSLEEDLLPLTLLLRSKGLPHQIFEEGGQQVLAVFEESHVQPVRDLYRAWRAGEVRIEVQPGEQPAALRSRLQWRQSPVSVAVALLCIAVFLLMSFGSRPWLSLLGFLPVQFVHGQPVFSAMGAEYWRLVTPVFLHFGWLHIAFNLLWFWEFGARLERVLGKLNYLGILLVIAAVSNFSQFLASGPSLFGGLSGVVYGLLGFCAVAPRIQPAWQVAPPTPVLLFMIGWLVVCMSGLVEAAGFGAIANAAHLGGLLAGAALGGLFAALSRSLRA
ncbi:rhomboid family intramembrane serine protease [Haliea sp. E17]|uniref:rhomboid family intramembrane serine protease n=1 Tax=Haliea sp. E17 TaxID=3401576 RepID=UPI003AAE167F